MKRTYTVLLLALPALALIVVRCSSSNSENDAGSDASTQSDVVSSADASDSATDAGSDASDCTGLLYCDGFETYEAGAITNNEMLGSWKASVNGGDAGITAVIDTLKPYRGTKALHITVTASDAANATLSQTATAGLVPGNNMFGRAMVYYSNTQPNDLPLAVHSWLFNASGRSDAADGGVSMNMGGGGAKMQLNYHPPLPLTEQSVQGGTMTTGTWHCVQWQYDGSGTPAKDVAMVWVDGVVAVNVPVTQGWNFATPWTVFQFGFTHYQILANPVDVYLDEFALNGSMIPCP